MNDAVLLKEIKDNITMIQTAMSRNNDLARIDYDMFNGKQWDPQMEKDRTAQGRPSLTYNVLPQFVKHVVNEMRRNKASIEVTPRHNATKEKANVIQGICRFIEKSSRADIAYTTAAEHAAIGGWGYWRIVTEYADERSIDQIIKIKRLPDPFCVGLDPMATEFDRSDAKFGCIWQDMSVEAFKEEYPDSTVSSLNLKLTSNYDKKWINKDKITVAEYYKKEFKKEWLYVFPDGTRLLSSEIPKEFDRELLQQLKDSGNARETETAHVTWYKVNGAEILERKPWPGKYIPIIMVVGNEMCANGETILSGIVRPAIGAQKTKNFMKTSAVEVVALSPKAPWLIAEGQTEGYTQMWQTANQKNWSSLIWKPVLGPNGEMLPPPQRTPPSTLPAAELQLALSETDEMKAITGIYNASLGNQSGETSGVGINARKIQSENANYNYPDNEARAIEYTACQIVDLIPKVYNSKRIQKIIQDDEETSEVLINSETPDENGDIWDLTEGEYNVSVNVGPTFSSQRAESIAYFNDAMKYNPAAAGVFSYFMMKNSDFPGADQAADALKSLLPPQVIEAIKPETKKMTVDDYKSQLQQANQILQQLEQQADQMEQHIQQLAQQNQQLKAGDQNKIELKQMDIQIEEMRAKVKAGEAKLRARTDIDTTQMDNITDENIANIHHKREINLQGLRHEREVELQRLNADANGSEEGE